MMPLTYSVSQGWAGPVNVTHTGAGALCHSALWASAGSYCRVFTIQFLLEQRQAENSKPWLPHASGLSTRQHSLRGPGMEG